MPSAQPLVTQPAMTWTAGVNANGANCVSHQSKFWVSISKGPRHLRHQRESASDGTNTDGLDNSSITLPNELMNALARASKAESLNSFTSLLVGIVGMSDRKSPAYKEVSGALRRFQRDVGFSSFIEVDSLDEDAASSLADFLYNSIHIVNDSLGTGCVSPLLAH